MKYKTILIDIDDTLLDFQKSEKIAIQKTMEYYNVKPTDKLIRRYKEINLKYWRMFERKEIEREALLVARFKEFFGSLNKNDLNFSEVNDIYFSILASFPVEIEGAEQFLIDLSENYDIYAITNGVKRVQIKRLSLVNITKYFKKIYISEEVGYQKPDVRFFEYVLDDLNINNRKEVLIIGDSLTSDIKGGINSNIDTMWYNPHYLPIGDGYNYTYELFNYNEFYKIIND